MENEKFETLEPISETSSETNKIENRAKSIIEIITRLYKKDEIIEIHEEVTNFVEKLKSKYSDTIYDYALYNALIGSSPKIAWSEFPEDKIDLPEEEYSIEKFVERLAEKYKDK